MITSKTILTSVIYQQATTVPTVQPQLVIAVYQTIVDDPDDNINAIINTQAYQFGANDDVSGQPALVQAIWNAVFVSPKPPVE
jgi:hypothetical protein